MHLITGSLQSTRSTFERLILTVSIPLIAAVAYFKSESHLQTPLPARSIPEPYQYVEGASWNPDLVCLEGTRTSLLDKIMQMIEAPDCSELGKGICIVDVLGSGKTAIAHSVSKSCATKGILASSFFDRGTTDRSSLDRFLSNLTRFYFIPQRVRGEHQ